MSAKQPYRLGVRGRIAALVVGLMALAVLAYTLLLAPALRGALRSEQERTIDMYGSMVASQVNWSLSAAIRELQLTVQLDVLQSMEPDAVNRALERLDKTSAFFLHSFVLDAQGTVVARPSKPDRVGEDRSNREYFTRARDDGEPHIADLNISSAGNLSLVVGVPIKADDGTFVGVLAGSFGLMDRNRYLYDAIVQPRVIFPAQVVLLTGDNVVIASSIESAAIGERLTGWNSDSEWVSSRAPIPMVGWSVAVRVPSSVITARVTAASRWFLVLALGSLAAILVLGLVLAHRVSSPLRRLTSSLSRYGHGGRADPLPLSREGEIRNAEMAFNAMLNERANAAAEREQLEIQVRHAQKLQSVGTLAAGVAHDFNNLLTPLLLGTGQLTPLLADNPVGTETLELMTSAANRARDLVQRLLAFGRLSEAQRQIVSLKQVVSEALKLVQMTLPKEIELHEDLEEVGNACVDPSQMHQVVLNLCTNAAHAICQGAGRIDVCLRLDSEERAVLSIQDTGAGMDAETRERVFEPFFTTKPVGSGTGLGLSVVYGIVSDHDGQIEVDTEPGRGTKISVFLPLTLELPTAETTGNESQSLVGQGRRILVVDDDAQVAEITVSVLASNGYVASIASSPEEALRNTAEAPEDFDLVITDNRMIGMTGSEFSRRLRSQRPSQRIMMATGFADESALSTCKELGILLLRKPFSRDAFVKAVHEAAAAVVEAEGTQR